MRAKPAHVPTAMPRPRQVRRGSTLMEAMIASTLLAIAVTAVGGTLAASYAQDQSALEQRSALEIARQSIEELAALPLTSTGSELALVDFASYADIAAPASSPSLLLASPAGAAAPAVIPAGSYVRRVTVQRLDSPAQANAVSGKLALVTVEIESSTGRIVRLRRMLTPTLSPP